MARLINGIHHITALAGSPQKNLDFYAGILGLRFVKKTVNFDAPQVYHLYYGNETGQPGTIMTFFPYEGIPRGRRGTGMLNTTSFSAPATALQYWETRLKRFGLEVNGPFERFQNEVVIYFEDHDGLGLELVFTDRDSRPPYADGPVPPEHAIRGFYNVEIGAEGYERTAGLLTEQMDHTLLAEQGNRFRFATTDLPGSYIDIVCSPDNLRALPGGGTIHHIAFGTPNAQSQLDVRTRIAGRMLNPTPVIDRQYFQSVYFREPGGVLFEIATEEPGFAVDESPDRLGRELMLPPQYEPSRAEIETALPAIGVHLGTYR